MKTLVTGGKGFIAQNIEAEIKTTRKDADLRNYDEVIDCLIANKPSRIINCASKHGSFESMQKEHISYLEDNFVIGMNVMKAAYECNVESLIQISSIAALKSESDGLISSKAFLKPNMDTVSFGYNFSKFATAQLTKVYARQFGLNYKTVYLANCYGPHDKISPDGTLIGNLISRFFLAMKSNSNITLYGNGLDRRSFTYAPDLSEVLNEITADTTDSKEYLVGNPQSFTVREIVDKIKCILNFEYEVVFDNNLNHKPISRILDETSAYSSNMKWTSLDEGLKRTIDWYVDFQANKVDSK
jgi:GDP-L-fucose synthase